MSPVAIESHQPGDRLPNLERLFQQMNSHYFNDEIPSIPVVWSKRMTRSAGIFWWRQRGLEFESGIRLSLPLLGDRPLRDLEATLAHEMIHAWVGLHLQELRHGHGVLFCNKMAEINRATDRFRVTQHHSFMAEVQKYAKCRWDCIECGKVYRRQRNTIDLKRHRCGKCRGQLKRAALV
ncbi:SprT-like domain-containing protein [Synechococcus sp. PCC 7336]|uniref:SprT-like domain-containing protein n=1 Tax=Synechococcus sp. PCC 7336 TaxID=195250 RepID=UPI0003454571|nr:SprT-like domain-containing protein [Synechococcus sp. PCC 7336]